MYWASEHPTDAPPMLGDGALPPHLHSGRYVEHFYLAFLLGALVVLGAGTALFGLGALRVCGLAVAGALLAATLGQATTQRYLRRPARRAYWFHAAHVGSVLGLTLPVTVPWYVPAVGGVVAVLIGKELLGGLGNGLWHPALVGRAAVTLMFAAQVAPASVPFLARGFLLTGSVRPAADTAVVYHGYQRSTPTEGMQAWTMAPPITRLSHRCYGQGGAAELRPESWTAFLRDELPPWPDTVWGHVGGGIGETCIPVLALVGLALTYRGYLRWQAPVAALLTVGVLTTVWPILVAGGLNPAAAERASRWCPILYTEDGLAVGAGVVLFHLTGGGLWLACVLIAGDPATSPLTRRGQAIYGLGLGILIVIARCNPWYSGVPGAEYWAVLGMNTLVPLIDRVSKRRVVGRNKVSGGG